MRWMLKDRETDPPRSCQRTVSVEKVARRIGATAGVAKRFGVAPELFQRPVAKKLETRRERSRKGKEK